MTMTISRRWITLLILGLLGQSALAQFQAVEQVDKGIFISSEPTITFLWPSGLGNGAKATLVFIPGGEGSAGMKPSWSEDSPYLTRYHFNRTLRQLSDKTASSGAFNVVIYDHPAKFKDARFLSDRAGDDHMVRIESVVRHYADKLKRPIWLMGHSNGGYSIAEFQRYLLKNNKSNLVHGMIFSAGRVESVFGNEINQPMLFLASENDGCAKTTPQSTKSLFERIRNDNKAPTEFVMIKTAQAEARDPCFSGAHMYFSAGDEVGKVLDDFLTRHTPPTR